MKKKPPMGWLFKEGLQSYIDIITQGSASWE